MHITQTKKEVGAGAERDLFRQWRQKKELTFRGAPEKDMDDLKMA